MDLDLSALSLSACKKPATCGPPRQQKEFPLTVHVFLSSQIYLRRTSCHPLRDLSYRPFLWSGRARSAFTLALTRAIERLNQRNDVSLQDFNIRGYTLHGARGWSMCTMRSLEPSPWTSCLSAIPVLSAELLTVLLAS